MHLTNSLTREQLKVFETVPDHYLILSTELRVLTVSAAFLSAFNKERQEIEGKVVLARGGNQETKSAEHLQEQLDTALATGLTQELVIHASGQPCLPDGILAITITPVADAQGAVSYLILKVGEEKPMPAAQLAKSLAYDQEVLHTIFMEAPTPIAIFEGEQMVYQLVNPAYQQIFPGRKLLGKPVMEALPELEGTHIFPLLKQVYQSGETYRVAELPLMLSRHEDGALEEIFWTFTLQARRNSRGAINGIFVFANDVTDQVRARQKIEKSQEDLKRFKFLADQARDAFILMREDGSFAYLNQQAMDAWGYDKDEISSIRVPDVDPIYQDEMFLQLFARAQKETIPQFETVHRHKDGHIFPVEVNLGGLMIDGKPHLFAVSRDLTERKKAEAALELKNQQLQRINNDLDNFIYTASHDLKAPISNIEGLFQALQRSLPAEVLTNARIERIMDMVQESVERFRKTIASLTEVVKLQKEYSGEAVTVAVEKVVQDVQLDLKPMIDASGACIQTVIPNALTIKILEKNLRSIVYNLLSNAIKYRAPERELSITISCKHTDGYTVLEVRDNGLGMAPDRLNQLFTMFKRFHTHVEGTGIGLYMVKKMVENAGGHIEVESEEGVGSAFQVFFPLQDKGTA